MKTAVILGAGFSKNSGMPVQAEIPELLITHDTKDEFENAVSNLLKKFMHDIYGYNGGKNFPNLDDIFTCIDISTNSGHHLGINYSPLELRGIRRFLVYRVFSILEKSFIPISEVKMLIETLSQKRFYTKYVVLNWDNVLEKYILALNNKIKIDYCNGGLEWNESKRGTGREYVKLIKPHGSCNWLYCDNCRVLYYDTMEDITLKEKAGFLESDIKLLREVSGTEMKKEIIKSLPCKACGNEISSHIATFSYRKTFRGNSFSNIWNEAEKCLSNASRWVFIGYSLPDADYEFKHLLKIAELKLEHVKKEKLKIDIVLLNSNKTIDKYESFFGNKLDHIFNEGIKEYNEYVKTI